MQLRIRIKSELPAGKEPILVISPWSFTVVIDHTVAHLIVKNNWGGGGGGGFMKDLQYENK